ncbi:hypothetical protein PDIDSM_8481 [Penicillium digitatum]|nr:hypothetical protein PDIDSM_8481 [Penicillium digitatum]
MRLPSLTDDDSSFEEVSKSLERPSRPVAAESASPRVSSPLRPKEAETKQTETKPESTLVSSTVLSHASETPSPATFIHKNDIEEIKKLIVEQTKTIASQAQQMQTLTAEIEALKSKLN